MKKIIAIAIVAIAIIAITVAGAAGRYNVKDEESFREGIRYALENMEVCMVNYIEKVGETEDGERVWKFDKPDNGGDFTVEIYLDGEWYDVEGHIG